MARTTLEHSTTVASRLDEEEIRALACVAKGMTLDTIARRLDVSDRTVRRRIRALCDKLDVTTPIEAVVWAARRKLI